MKVKATLLVVISLVWSSFCFGQQSTSEDSVFQEIAQRQTVIYRLAKYFGDASTARSALYEILALNTQNTQILDTLALEYYQEGQWLSAALVGQEVTKLDQEDVFALEIAASALENLGAKDQALVKYESLYLKNDDITTLYKVAFLQYDMKKYAESVVSADALLKRPKVKELQIVFTKQDKKQQDISMEASVYNLKGLIAAAQDAKEEAKEWFNKAIAIAPDFELAKGNLDALNK